LTGNSPAMYASNNIWGLASGVFYFKIFASYLKTISKRIRFGRKNIFNLTYNSEPIFKPASIIQELVGDFGNIYLQMNFFFNKIWSYRELLL
jgi:hypothetical protein